MRRGVGAAGLLLVFLATGPSVAAAPRGNAPAANGARAPLALFELQPVTPAYVPPGANVAEAPPDRRPSVTDRWWFWAAVGGVVVTTVAVILIAGRAPSPPASTLGNMEAFQGR